MMSNISLGFLPQYDLIQESDRKTLKIDLAQIQDISDLSREQWQKPVYQNGLVWLAGGGSYLLEQRYVLLVRRSSTAPSSPGCLTIATGLSDSRAEWSDPSLIRRELFEEIVLLDPEQRLFYYPDCDSSAAETIKLALHGSRYQDCSACSISASEIEDLKMDQVLVHDKGRITERAGLLHIKDNQVNFLFAIELKLSKPISHIEFYDTEFKMEKGSKVFLNREIFLYDLATEQVLDLKLHRTCEMPFTAHAWFFLEKIRDYWRKKHG